MLYIPNKIDIHSLRRNYAKNLYKDIISNPDLRSEYMKHYLPRKELKTQQNRDGIVYTKEIKSDVYKDRDGNVYKRDDLYVISNSRGHSRLCVSVIYYLK